MWNMHKKNFAATSKNDKISPLSYQGLSGSFKHSSIKEGSGLAQESLGSNDIIAILRLPNCKTSL